MTSFGGRPDALSYNLNGKIVPIVLKKSGATNAVVNL
jgi:hypothetical protein